MLDRRVVCSRSLRSRLLCGFLRYAVKPRLSSERYDLSRSRQGLERSMSKRRVPADVRITPVNHPAIRGEWQTPSSTSDRCILYLHGGGYAVGSPRVYRGMTARLAELAGARVFALDYRLAPEHPFPAALEDAVNAYEWLLGQGIEPAHLSVAGDSAGGGLALAMLLRLRDSQRPLPASAVVFSPFADMLATGRSVRENSERCSMFNGAAVPRAASVYLQGQDGCSPLASPVYGDYRGLPPLAIYVSDSEVLRDDGCRVAEKADKAGVSVQLNIWKNQPHAWPAFYPLLPEAEQCLRETGDFTVRTIR